MKEQEFNYEEEAKLVLHKKSVGETEADYNCITKGTVLGEVEKLASLADCPIELGVRMPNRREGVVAPMAF